jgi:tRNA G18 (ribose-2'-O)-methylase SpoU
MALKSISSKENPLFKQLKALANDNTAYRRSRQVWLEGEHLCQAAFDSGLRFSQLVLLDSVQADSLALWAARCDTVLQH